MMAHQISDLRIEGVWEKTTYGTGWRLRGSRSSIFRGWGIQKGSHPRGGARRQAAWGNNRQMWFLSLRKNKVSSPHMYILLTSTLLHNQGEPTHKHLDTMRTQLCTTRMKDWGGKNTLLSSPIWIGRHISTVPYTVYVVHNYLRNNRRQHWLVTKGGTDLISWHQSRRE
jgi:hypothetical protein